MVRCGIRTDRDGVGAIIGDPGCIDSGRYLVGAPTEGRGPSAAGEVSPDDVSAMNREARQEKDNPKQFFHRGFVHAAS